jgi:hypothetical protein
VGRGCNLIRMKGVQSARGLLLSIGRLAAGAGERFGVGGHPAASAAPYLPRPALIASLLPDQRSHYSTVAYVGMSEIGANLSLALKG